MIVYHSVIIKNNKYSSTSHFHTKEFEWIKWLLQISNRMLPNYVTMSNFLPLEQPRPLDLLKFTRQPGGQSDIVYHQTTSGFL